MYKCGVCNSVVEAGAPAYKLVVEKRNKSYQNPSKKVKGEVKYSKGWEIVKEVLVCRECFGKGK